jgi:hypothetical protein
MQTIGRKTSYDIKINVKQQRRTLKILFDQVHTAVASLKNVLSEDGPVRLKHVAQKH